MKFSEQWLREWVNPDLTTAELADQLTMAGLEVDSIEPVAAEFDKVVVAQVTKISKHPDADKLRVCEVNVGDKTPLQIVCGAANVAEGMKVPAALVGAKLPGGFKIKKSKLRGVESFGMLCSEAELGLAESAEGLMPLAEDMKVGQSVREALQLDDVTIELGITPNRGDCLSLAGIARETAALNRLALTKESDAANKALVKASIKDTVAVSIEASNECRQYFGRVIKGINVNAETPLWMQERLRRCGLRSISPVVDVTNFVLLELGQPMHAFDLAKLKGGLRVCLGKGNESLVLLDGQEVKISAETLLIADDSGPLALAGIMGGVASAVDDTTSDIFLESAYFDPEAIAGKARSYGLHTDSSHRFERGVSSDLQGRAIERATALLLEIVGGKAGPVAKIKSSAGLDKIDAIQLRYERIERILGMKIEKKEVSDILTRLDLKIKENKQGWLVTPPAFRFDIRLEIDLIEELARIVGYNNLTVSRPESEMKIKPMPEAVVGIRKISQMLVDIGYQEVVTYSFVEKKSQDIIDPDHPAIALANPISDEMGVMRTNLWSGLLETAKFNLHRQQDRLFLFESGLKFIQQDTEIQQEMSLAGLVTGTIIPEQWGSKSRDVDFFDLKGHLTSLMALTGDVKAFRFETESHAALHPGQSARIYRGDVAIGWIGALHPGCAKKLDISQKAYLFEVDVAGLETGQIPAFKNVSKYPAIRRDVALVVDEKITAQAVINCITKVAPETLVNVELFDMYTGEGIDSGRKSLALGLTLQDLSRTLIDSDVESVMQDILQQLQQDLGATPRQ